MRSEVQKTRMLIDWLPNTRKVQSAYSLNATHTADVYASEAWTALGGKLTAGSSRREADNRYLDEGEASIRNN